MQGYISFNNLLATMLEHESFVRQSISNLSKELNIYGFTYSIVNRQDKSYTALCSHVDILEKYIERGFLNESPYIFMPDSLPKYHLNNFQDESLSERAYHVSEFMRSHGTNKIFVIKIDMGAEFHFAAFHSPNESINQVNTFISNIPLLRQFSDLFFKHYKKTLYSSFVLIDELIPNGAGTKSIIHNDLKVVPSRIGIPKILYKTVKNKSDRLTKRERQIVNMYANGMTAQSIGKACYISQKTVERHISNSKDKLGFNTKLQLYKYVSEQGLLNDSYDMT